MANPIVPKHSSTPGKVPTTSDLLLGEIAVNDYDGKLFTKKSVAGLETVVEIGAGSSGGLTVNSTTISGGVAGRFLYDDGSKLQETAGLSWDTANKRVTASATYSFGWSGIGISSPDSNSVMIATTSNPVMTLDAQAQNYILNIVNQALQKVFDVTGRTDFVANFCDGLGKPIVQIMANGNTLFGGNILLPFREVRAATTITVNDFTLNCVGTFTVTAPTMPWGTIYNIKNSGSGLITVSGSIDGQTTWLVSPGDNMQIQSTGKGYIII